MQLEKGVSSDATFVCLCAQAQAIADLLYERFAVRRCAVVHSDDVYGQGLADSFEQNAQARGLAIVRRLIVSSQATQQALDDLAEQLTNADVRVIVLMCDAALGGFVMRSSFQQVDDQVGGPGFLWFGSDALVSDRIWQLDAQLSANVELRDNVLKGLVGFSPSAAMGGAEWSSFEASMLSQPSTCPINGTCSSLTDDFGEFIWQNADTSECVGSDAGSALRERTRRQRPHVSRVVNQPQASPTSQKERATERETEG